MAKQWTANEITNLFNRILSERVKHIGEIAELKQQLAEAIATGKGTAAAIKSAKADAETAQELAAAMPSVSIVAVDLETALNQLESSL